MLRSSVATGRQVLLSSARQRTAAQWLSRAGASSRFSNQRFFADAKPPTTGAPTPVTPSSTSPVPPEIVIPKPEPIEQGSAVPPVAPTPAPKKGGRFRRFLLYLLLTSGFAYGGGIFLALKFDNFHDFFTEFIPYGEESVLYFEERDFYRRFPNTLKSQVRFPTRRDDSNQVTIPSKSGLTSKVAEEESADLSQKGPHMSSIKKDKSNEAQAKPAAAKPEEKTAAVEKAKEAKTAKEEPSQPAVKEEPRQPALPAVAPLEFAKVNEGDEAIVQELVKTFNDIITVIGADESAYKFSKPVEKAKEELQKVGEKIIAVREDARRAAQEEINQAHATFDESARELIRRFEEARAADAAQYREEFEAEREKLAHAYQEKIRTELQRAQELAEQRLKNELVEQAIELNRKYLHEVKDLVEREREGRLSKLNELTANVSELEQLTTGWREVIDTNLKTQQLQVAVDAVRSVLERSASRPFVRELVAVKELAAEDPVVDAAIASINPTAYQRGIPSTSQIIERFRRVADEVRKASLLPEDAGIASHAASFVLSKVMFKKDAVAGSDDVESVLCRTESLLEEGNLDAAAREMNSLKGWAKILSKDWLGEVRRVLEVKQALETTIESPTPALSTLGPNETLSDPPQPTNTPHDASIRLRELQMNEGRASGELEGSTLGSSSRDGDKGSRAQRRTQSSGGFFVDSSFLPGSRSLRNSHHQFLRRSGSDRKEKREAPGPGLELPKKRSRFPWSRQKEEKSETGEGSTAYETTTPSQVTEATANQGQASETPENSAALGLDRDSLQIVNLALNLSESRKRNSLGHSASTRFPSNRRILSAGKPIAPYSDTQPITSVGGVRHSSPRHRDAVHHTLSDRYNKPIILEGAGLPAHAPSSVLSLLPQSVDSETLPSGVSESTLIRAEKARRHFELFSDYLRLISSLPPLERIDPSATDSVSVASNSGLSSRTYNPLQCIRNRKVRFRERCTIDTEAEGWYDTDRVHEWVDSVESLYSHRNHSAVERLQLPSFPKSRKYVSSEHHIDVDHLAASPPSSLRRASRASSVKARRPRSDWVIDPAEMLADAAWVEDDHNKSKLIDKDGHHLYPNPNLLIDVGIDDANLSLEENLQRHRQSMDSEQYTSRASLSDAHPSLTSGTRGRQRHRFRTSGRSTYDSDVSAKDVELSSRRLGLFSSSASTSSADDRLYQYLHADSAVSPGKSNPLTLGPSQTRGSGAISEDDSLTGVRYTPTHGSVSRHKRGAQARSEGKRSSMSSVPSIDDRYDTLTNMATHEGKYPDIQHQLGIFPSIASNLSPPSSRSPSPSKGRFPRARVSRHERSKSSIRTKENVDEHVQDADAARQDSLPETVGLPGSEPFPLAHQMPSSSYQDELDKMHSPMRKDTNQTESRLRGILKGPGKIAEKVGNEMSKVGDRIMKKDSLAHARKSSLSSLSSSDSELEDEADETKGDKLSGAKSLLRRLPAFADDASRPSRKNLDKIGTSNDAMLSPSLTSPAGQERLTHPESSDSTDVAGQSAEANIYNSRDGLQRDAGSFSTSLASKPDLHAPPTRLEKLKFGPELHTILEQIKKGRIRDQSVPFSLTRPPITGLAQAKVEASPASQNRRPALDAQSRSWSISNRSISTSIVTGVPGKREVERTRALLLSSGIKAREITRRAGTVREPPPEFLLRSYDDASVPIPRVTRLCEHDAAAQALLRKFDETHCALRQVMDNFSGSVSSPLNAQLSRLEKIVNEDINPRVQAATQDAEDLSIQLNTTSTLAVKQLSDTLDKGIRRRHRRLRWVRRTGFVMLEWALVGMLWWVWLIVMAFKVLRGIFRGFLSGVRWVLWL
ncbi:MICOS complex subunit MIC60 [Aspergillus saccharolyticus JOP 1030-1]|uniref:MICOS complex subunit MIC60 n=1 Tax=Aspergillus saccharolyticus JOP 1030-1 TaxID=1450539 RepID=A0A319A5R3_9EURO|nr:hypothetical protein BP01DRAFT_389939 [Aspergillus saccharolyticus JOP 1030-1]PYH47398.1 hypothetical protein BP01DRAFT_389939 [Aspergillus saccharolyticus JOP 1030-1]